MHRGYVGAVCLAIVMIAATAAQARDWTARLGGGVAISKPVGAAALSASPIQISQLDLLGRWRLQHRLSAEARVALQFHHHLSPLASLFAPLELRTALRVVDRPGLRVLLSAGAGLAWLRDDGRDLSAWRPVLPAGAAVQLPVDDWRSIEMGMQYRFVAGGNDPGHVALSLGLSFSPPDGHGDPDYDGLTTAEERRLGSDFRNPDSDGDGLSDGAEFYRFATDPLRFDSDGDGLSDHEEVAVFQTDPLRADSDGDGLRDREEVAVFQTDPLLADSDGDGRSDYEEFGQAWPTTGMLPD